MKSFCRSYSSRYFHKDSLSDNNNKSYTYTRNHQDYIICSNCGGRGHKIKECYQPITSYGIITFTDNHSNNNDYSDESIKSLLPIDLSYKPPALRSIYKYLMIQRKNTMSFIDIIRGKYPSEYCKQQETLKIYINEITELEKELFLTKTFSELWDNLWLNKNSKIYKNEFKEASYKYACLNITEIIEKYNVFCYKAPEFSFPKGRKNVNESLIKCAEREFVEETGYSNKDYTLLNHSFQEDFVGTNNIAYRHVYFLAKMNPVFKKPTVDINNIVQYGEVSNLGWFDIKECLHIIRPYDIKKKELIKVVDDYVNCLNIASLSLTH
jgi:8-oxo-dGTP pyrophosphatase MutT (NUDIX family)